MQHKEGECTMPKTFKEYCGEMRGKVREITNAEFKAMEHALLVDVRAVEQFEKARIPGAISVPKQVVEMKIEDLAGEDDVIVVYCGGGSNSSLVARNLVEMGYTQVHSLKTGIKGWIAEGRDVE